MRTAWLIAATELRIQLRRGSIFVLGFVAPFALALVMNLVFGGLDDSDAPATFDVGIADLDGGEEAAAFVAVLDEIASSGLLDVTTFDDEGAARAAVDDGDVGAAWVVPAGFSDAVRTGAGTEIVVVGNVDHPTSTAVARSIAERYATGVGASSLAALVAVQTGVVDPAGAGEVAAQAAAVPPVVTLVSGNADARLLDVTTSLIAGMALFFVFFTAGLPITAVLEERSQGTLSRLLAAPIPAWSVTAGKVLAAVALGTLSLSALMVASTVLMGADWGPPVGALLLAVAAVIAAVGVMSVAGSLARTTEQAGNAQGIVAIVLAILGGAFTPIPGSEGGILSVLRRLTPHGWWFDGITDLQHDGLGAALPAVGVLLAIGVVTLTIGLGLARRVLRR